MLNRLQKFTSAYITCALWCGVLDHSSDNESDPNNYDLMPEDISDNTLRVMREDCIRFFSQIEEILPLGTEDRAGHDFWFTRNGHGSGFWDRDVSVYGSQEVRDNLNVLCKNFRTIPEEGMPMHRWGEFELYIGDDGKIYHC